MKYIDVTVKKTGQVINIMEAEFDEKLYSKDVKVKQVKEAKKPVETKENKAAPERKTKEAKTITSGSMKRAGQ